MTTEALVDTEQSWLNIIAVSRRHQVHVCDVYRAVMDGDLPARLPSDGVSSLTILASDAQRWAAQRQASDRSQVLRSMLAAVPLAATSGLRTRA